MAQELDKLQSQIDELNDIMGDKDAELLLVHTRADSNRRALARARQALQNLLNNGQIQSSLALQLHDIVASLERDGA